MTARAPELLIMVCGAADRGDDRAALAAIAQVLPALPSDLASRIAVHRCPQLDVTDLINVSDGEACLVIDTVVGVEPGSIVTLSLQELSQRTDGMTPRSSHALTIGDALCIAEVIRGSLPSGAFVGIGGRWFGYSERFSRPVTAGMPALAAAIRRAIEDLLPARAST